MTREDAFIADIIANPADDAVRLIYADWLDGQGREEYGEFIRVQCELVSIPTDTQLLQALKESPGEHRYTSAEEFSLDGKGGIWWTKGFDTVGDEEPHDVAWDTSCDAGAEIDSLIGLYWERSESWSDNDTVGCRIIENKRVEGLRRRERELWGYLPSRTGVMWELKAEFPGWGIMLPCDDGSGLTHHYPWAWVRRGFIAEVRLSCQNWIAHGPALVRRHPIERCVIVDKRPTRERGAGHVFSWATAIDRNFWALPWGIYRHLFPTPSPHPIHAPLQTSFPTEEAAIAAISEAALLYARQTEPAMV